MDKDKFSVGDKVEVLDEAISGVVEHIDGTLITLVTTEGFPMKYDQKDLVKVRDGIVKLNRG